MKKRRKTGSYMNSLVTFKTATTTVDSIGDAVESFSTYKEIWAAIWPVSASEQIKNGQEGMDITHRFRIWYDSGITHNMRVTYGTRTFKIISIVNPDESNRLLDILAVEEI